MLYNELDCFGRVCVREEKEIMKLNKFFDFTHDSYGLKASLFFFILLLLLALIASVLGLTGGRGGNPQESYEEEHYQGQ